MSAPLGCAPWYSADTKLPLPAVNDAEGARLPSALPAVVDAHVHLFPDGVFDALWRWFDTNAWPIRYKLRTPAVLEFLFSRGVQQVVGLHYSHKPGMARALNAYVAALCAQEPRVRGVATVLPGEDGAVEILREGFAAGLRGVKLHCHVQCFAPDADDMEPLYALCEREHQPIVMHAGREPAFPRYKVDARTLCSAERVEAALRSFPKLQLCVPHLGADEFDAYERLLSRYDNLWLDTTMAISGYFPVPDEGPLRLLRARPDRVLYGTDFPNLPYAWDREVIRLSRAGLSEPALAALLSQNARRLFQLPDASG